MAKVIKGGGKGKGGVVDGLAAPHRRPSGKFFGANLLWRRALSATKFTVRRLSKVGSEVTVYSQEEKGAHKITRDGAIASYNQDDVNKIKAKLKFPDNGCDYDENNAAYRDGIARYGTNYVPSAADQKPTEKEYQDYRNRVDWLQMRGLFGINLAAPKKDKQGGGGDLNIENIYEDREFFKLLFLKKRHDDNIALWNRHDDSGEKKGKLFKRKTECGELRKKINEAKNIEEMDGVLKQHVSDDNSDQQILINILHGAVSNYRDSRELPFTFYRWRILAELALIEKQMAILMRGQKHVSYNASDRISLPYTSFIVGEKKEDVEKAKTRYSYIAQAVIEPVVNPNLACLKQLETLRANGQLNAALIQPAMEEFHSKFASEIDFSDISLSRAQLAALKELDASLVKNKDRKGGDKGRFGKVMFRAATGAGKTFFVEKIVIPKFGDKLDVVSIDLNSSKAQFNAIIGAEERSDNGAKYKLIVLDEATFYGNYFGERFINGWVDGFGVLTEGKVPETLEAEIEAVETAALKCIRNLRARGANVLILGASESIEKVEYAECVRLDDELRQEEIRGHLLDNKIEEDREKIRVLSRGLKGEKDYDKLKADSKNRLSQAKFWSSNPQKKNNLKTIILELKSADIFTEGFVAELLFDIDNGKTTDAIGRMEAQFQDLKIASLQQKLIEAQKALIAKIGIAQANKFFQSSANKVDELKEKDLTDAPKEGKSAQEISVAKIEKKRQKLAARRTVLGDLKQARELVKTKFEAAEFVVQEAAKYVEDNLGALVANDAGLKDIFNAKDGGAKPSNQRLQYILPDFDINAQTCTEEHLAAIQAQSGADIIIVPHVMVEGDDDKQTSKMGCRVYHKKPEGGFELTAAMTLDQLDGKDATEAALAIESQFEKIVKSLEIGEGEAKAKAYPNVISFFGGPSKDGAYGGNVVGGNYKSSLGTTQQRIRIKSSQHTWADWAQWVGRNRNTDNDKFEGVTVIADRAADQPSFTKENLKEALEGNTARHEKAHTLAHLRLKVAEPGLDVAGEDKVARNWRILQEYVDRKGSDGYVAVDSIIPYGNDDFSEDRSEASDAEDNDQDLEGDYINVDQEASANNDSSWLDENLVKEYLEIDALDMTKSRTIEALRQRVAEYLESHNKDGKTAAEYARNYEDYLEIAVKNEADALAKTIITSDILRFERGAGDASARDMIIGGDRYPQKLQCYFLQFKNLEFNQDPVVPDAAAAEASSKPPIFGKESGLHLPSFSDCKFSNIDFSEIKNFHEWKFYGCQFDHCKFSENTKQTQFGAIGKDDASKGTKKRECKIFETDVNGASQDITISKIELFNKKPAEPEAVTPTPTPEPAAPAPAPASPNPSTSISNKPGIKISMERLRDPAKAPEHAK